MTTDKHNRIVLEIRRAQLGEIQALHIPLLCWLCGVENQTQVPTNFSCTHALTECPECHTANGPLVPVTYWHGETIRLKNPA